MTERDYGVGIDLGTSNSAICRLDTSRGVFDFQQARADGARTEFPSMVASYKGHLYFSYGAQRKEPGNPDSVLRNFKLLLRRNEPVLLGEDEYQPVDLMHEFLAHLKENYEKTFQQPLTRAVITVPAYEEFDLDYQARIRAAVAGRSGESPLFEDVVTLKEPDAVLMSLIEVHRLTDQRVLVFDMGGGTLDVSIREVHHNAEDPERPILKALAIKGSDIAGVRLTEQLGEWALSRWETKNRFTFSEAERLRAVRQNFSTLDEVKCQLSDYALRAGMDSKKTEHCHLEFAGRGQGYFDLDVPASQLTELSKSFCEAALETVEAAMAEGGLMPSDIDSYFTVGGTSQLPYMQHLLTDYLGKEPVAKVTEHGFIDPYLAISRGAAVYDWDRDSSTHSSGNMPNTAPILEQILPYDLSLLVNANKELKVLVPKGASLPYAEVVERFYMPVRDDNLDIAIYRGSGGVESAHPLARRTIFFPKPLPVNAEVAISFSVSEDGVMTVAALGEDGVPISAVVADSLTS